MRSRSRSFLEIVTGSVVIFYRRVEWVIIIVFLPKILSLNSDIFKKGASMYVK